MLTHFLQEFLGYSRIGGGMLYSIFQKEQILSTGNIDQVIGYIESSTLEDTFLLISPDAPNTDYVRRILWLYWYAIRLEKVMAEITIENAQTKLADPQIKALLFGEMNFAQMKALAEEEEEEEDEEDEDEFDDDEELEDEDEDE